MRTRGLMAILLSIGCAASSPSSGTLKPAPASPQSQRLAQLRDAALDQWHADDPAFARFLGLHEFDGRIPDFTEAGIKAQYARLHRFLDELATIDTSALSPDDALDAALLKSQAEQTLFRGEDMDDWEKSPRFYADIFSVHVYVDHDYAPLEIRAQQLLQHEKAGLAAVPNIRANLKGPLAKTVVELSIKIFRGYATDLRNTIAMLLKGIGSPEFQAEFARTNEALAKEADALADWLKTEQLPRADDSYVLGTERYAKLLRVQEGLIIPLARFKQMGLDNLHRDQLAYEELHGKVRDTKPTAEQLLPVGQTFVTDAHDFVLSHHIATLPTEDPAIVREAPPFRRFNPAFIDRPGPFEKQATTAYYYINKPDPAWPQAQQDGYLPTYGGLSAMTTHEVYPGHFLQGQWWTRAPTRTQKSINSYSFSEGWAHYAEQLMIEEGFHADDPQYKLGQVTMALQRDCRFLASVGLHAEGMTLEQAEKLFMDECHQDKGNAHEQAVRGTIDPGYFAYTLGKIEILALREEVKSKLGARFSLRGFHDALLSHGAPPVPLIHDRVLAELTR
jgi:uncharacterized protein (DUF885 family)